jgi:hypothetical protein
MARPQAAEARKPRRARKRIQAPRQFWPLLRDVLKHVEFEVLQPYTADGRIPMRHSGLFAQETDELRDGPGSFTRKWLAEAFLNHRWELAFIRPVSRWRRFDDWEPPAQEMVYAVNTELDGAALKKFLPKVAAALRRAMQRKIPSPSETPTTAERVAEPTIKPQSWQRPGDSRAERYTRRFLYRFMRKYPAGPAGREYRFKTGPKTGRGVTKDELWCHCKKRAPPHRSSKAGGPPGKKGEGASIGGPSVGSGTGVSQGKSGTAKRSIGWRPFCRVWDWCVFETEAKAYSGSGPRGSRTPKQNPRQ